MMIKKKVSSSSLLSKYIPHLAVMVIALGGMSIMINANGDSFRLNTEARRPVPTVPVFTQYVSVALKDPFYPDPFYYRRFIFPTTPITWGGSYTLSPYTITSIDPQIGNKSITFYAAGYSLCPDKLEMGLPFGQVPYSTGSYITCSSPHSTQYHFTFPRNPVTTTSPAVTLNSPVSIKLQDGSTITAYVPLSWWTE